MLIPDLRLTPFFVLALAFFAVGKPHLDYPPESVLSAVIKAAPIWFLVAYLSLVIKDERQANRDTYYTKWVRRGLKLSSVGDLFIVWRQTMFLPGVLCFAGAQLCYIKALSKKVDMHPLVLAVIGTVNSPDGRVHKVVSPRSGEAKYKVAFAVLSIASYVSYLPRFESFFMGAAVLVYNILITSMGYFALQRHFTEKSKGSLYGLLGAVSFLLSDAIIGTDRWVYRIYFSEAVVMVTYYAAQYFISLGCTQPNAHGK